MSTTVRSGILSVSLFTIGRLGVPIFLFLTGYLLLGKKYDYQKYVKFLKKSFFGLLITTEIWIILYNIFNTYFYNTSFDMKMLIRNMLFLEQTKMMQMWYMPVILGLYLFIPFISNALNNTDIKSLYFPIGMAFVFLCIIPVINAYRSATGQESFRALLDMSFIGGYYGLLIVMGYMMKNGVFRRIKTPVLLIVGILAYLFTVGIQLYSAYHNVTYKLWYDSASLIIATIAIFELLSRVKWRIAPINKIVTNISLCSFGIFLVHNPISMLFFRYIDIQRKAIEVVVAYLITFLLSWLIVFCISKFKKLSHILFFTK